MSKQYRYPGVTPFTQAQQAIFFGRDQDVARLQQLVDREALVVLHSKSGLGKSSLLNAGLLPLIAEKGNYQPLVVRLGAKSEENQESPLAKTKSLLPTGHSLLQKLLPEEESLWTRAKALQLQSQQQPLFIFDQFEELFSYSDAEIKAFQQDLAELLFTNLPLRYRRQLDRGNALSEEEEDQLEERLTARILFAIRSDRLHLLDRFKDYFPKILRYSYELQALSLDDARIAIEAPAALPGDFRTAPYQYEEKALAKLLRYLQDEDGQVEAILIQMLCEHYEKQLVEPRQLKLLGLSEIGDPDAVVKDYYQEKINLLSTKERQAARRFIEEGLVSKGEEGLRLSLHESSIASQYGVSKALLNKLVDKRLLRSEPFLRGGYTYELSHDRLLPAVLQARRDRLQEEDQARNTAEAERLRVEAENQRKENVKARKQLREVRSLLALALLALAVAGVLGYQSYQQKAALEAANLDIQEKEKVARERLQAFEEAERLRKETEVGTLMRRATTYQNLNQVDLAVRSLRSALQIDSTRQDIQDRLRELLDLQSQ